jgi:hypothetical protein
VYLKAKIVRAGSIETLSALISCKSCNIFFADEMLITYDIFRTLIIGQGRETLNLVDTGLLTRTIRTRLEDLA